MHIPCTTCQSNVVCKCTEEAGKHQFPPPVVGMEQSIRKVPCIKDNKWLQVSESRRDRSALSACLSPKFCCVFFFKCPSRCSSTSTPGDVADLHLPPAIQFTVVAAPYFFNQFSNKWLSVLRGGGDISSFPEWHAAIQAQPRNLQKSLTACW